MVVGIVGLGLMGGSFAKAIKKYFNWEVVGSDHNKTHQKEALELGLVDKIVDMNGIKKADLIILAIPVNAIIKTIPNLVDVDKNTTIIDFGSTKSLIAKSIPKKLKKQFILSHPMAGTEKFGPNAAIDNLYENKIMVLCDINKTDIIHKNRAIDIFTALKMKLVYMDSKEHDLHACYISHLPHAISFALANTVMDYEDPKHIITLAAGGFKDMSRIAKSSPIMWSDIFLQNKQHLLNSLDIFTEHINSVKQFIEDEDYDNLVNWMKKANKLHNIL